MARNQVLRRRGVRLFPGGSIVTWVRFRFASFWRTCVFDRLQRPPRGHQEPLRGGDPQPGRLDDDAFATLGLPPRTARPTAPALPCHHGHREGGPRACPPLDERVLRI